MTVKDYQPQIVAQFRHILSDNRLSHAYLFSGTFGAFEVALLIGKTLFCQTKVDGLACGHCRTCQMIERQEFPDVKVIEPTGNLIKTDTIRELVGEFSRSGFEGKAQVFIIKDSDKMHINAANSLLKMIEEPTSDSYIFLLTEDESKILPTIKSRCQMVSFPVNRVYLCHLFEQEGLLKDQALILSDVARDVTEAMSMAKSSKLLTLLKTCQTFVSLWLNKDDRVYLEATRLSLLVTDKAEQEQVFKMLLSLLGQEKSYQVATYLTALEGARKMWQANVSLQNALEYMVLP